MTRRGQSRTRSRLRHLRRSEARRETKGFQVLRSEAGWNREARKARMPATTALSYYREVLTEELRSAPPASRKD